MADRHVPTPSGGSHPSIEQAFHEVYQNVPKNVTATGKTGAAKNKMMQAIAFSKAGEGNNGS